MTNIVTKNFKSPLAQQFVESFTEQANNIYYLAVGKHVTYPAGDSNIPTPSDSVKDVQIDPYQEIIFGKKIQATDISLMTKRYDWTSGTVYAQYDDTDAELFNKQFYVVIDSGTYYYVYKVLENNNGAASISAPSNTSEDACNFITTADGYKWKLMYRLPEETFNKFATTDYMPVVTSANVSSASVDGAIDAIVVSNSGYNFISTLTGQFNTDDLRENIPTIAGNNITYRLTNQAASNSDFYVGSSIYLESGTGAGQVKRIINYSSNTKVITINSPFTTAPNSDTTYKIAPSVVITGDGTGAEAYAVVSSNTSLSNYIEKIEIVTRGHGYTYASATIAGNTGGLSVNAAARVVISPKGGHGYDAIAELGSSSVGMSVKLSNNENGYITTDNDYRAHYIIRDPKINDVTFTLNDEQGTFLGTEKIYQVDYKYLRGTVQLTADNTEIVGLLTEFNSALQVGDKIILSDQVLPYHFFTEVQSITNNEHIVVTSAPTFSTLTGKIAYAQVIAEGKRIGNSSPYLTATSVDPKFVTNKRIIGGTTGAFANVASITVSGKNYNNWNTFDNRTRIAYTSNTGTIAPDTKVFQQSSVLSNAYFHSSNGSYIFLTSEQGLINADPNDPLVSGTSNAQTYILGSVKYTPDLVKGSGQVIYIENHDPISRSNSQTETIRTILNF